ncbi:MAG: hypothetical protein Q9166_000405 [cf. Caloplaca sp. 2 TL-2023]
MASIETSTESAHNVVGAIIFVGYVLAALFLSTLIVIDLYQAYSSPSSSSSNKAKHGFDQSQIFIAFAILSFSTLSYHMLNYLIYSYQSWATSKHFEDLPGLHTSINVFNLQRVRFHIAQVWQWLTESTLFQNFAETVCKNSANFCWTQQALLVTMASALFISIEGSRRQIPHLWAYLAIGQILPISFAQNLFFVAIILYPISDSSKPTQIPNLVSQCLPIAAYYIFLYRAPLTVGKPGFLYVIVFMRTLLLCPFIFRNPLFQPLGSRTSATKNIHSGYSASYIMVLLGSAILFVRQTTQALSENGFREILTAVNSSPAVSALGYDFILYVVSCTALGLPSSEKTKINVA